MIFRGMETGEAERLRAGGVDANGQAPERAVSDGDGNPCRHCLGMIGKGEPMLVLAHRPFGTVQPYAEVGPVFLHAGPCAPYRAEAVPPCLDSAAYLARGYGADERIAYGTGRVVALADLPARADELLADPRVAFVHVRSASNNCWQARIDRDQSLPARAWGPPDAGAASRRSA